MTANNEALEDGWIAWHGGECPVPRDAMVLARFNDGWEDQKGRSAGRWNWSHDGRDWDIIAYRLVPPAVPSTPEGEAEAHTPGPWKFIDASTSANHQYQPLCIIRGNGKQVASFSWNDNSPYFPTKLESQANAHLIVERVNGWDALLAQRDALQAELASLRSSMADKIAEAVAAEREACARVAEMACLVPPDGGEPTGDERAVAYAAAAAIRARNGGPQA